MPTKHYVSRGFLKANGLRYDHGLNRIIRVSAGEEKKKSTSATNAGDRQLQPKPNATSDGIDGNKLARSPSEDGSEQMRGHLGRMEQEESHVIIGVEKDQMAAFQSEEAFIFIGQTDPRSGGNLDTEGRAEDGVQFLAKNYGATSKGKAGESTTKRIYKSFEERMQDLKLYKEKHGHLKVSKKENKGLAIFCSNIRQARKNSGKGAYSYLDADCIASLDALGFDWDPKQVMKSFEERVEALKLYKEKHGHLDVKSKEEKSLANFCRNVRQARKNPQKSGYKLTEDRVASLDALGFDWAPMRNRPKSSKKRTEDPKSYSRHDGGDSSLSKQSGTRAVVSPAYYVNSQDVPDKSTPSKESYTGSDSFADVHKKPHSTIEKDIKVVGNASAHQETPQQQNSNSEGVLHVSVDLGCMEQEESQVTVGIGKDQLIALKSDKTLMGIEQAHVQIELQSGESLIKGKNARDRVPFNPTNGACPGATRYGMASNKARRKRKISSHWLAELTAYKENHGHLDVKEKEDERLAAICSHLRMARNDPAKYGYELDEGCVASLDVLGFDWVNKSQNKNHRKKGENKKSAVFRVLKAPLDANLKRSRCKSFEERLEDLKSHKAKSGRLRVPESEDKSLAQFFRNPEEVCRQEERGSEVFQPETRETSIRKAEQEHHEKTEKDQTVQETPNEEDHIKCHVDGTTLKPENGRVGIYTSTEEESLKQKSSSDIYEKFPRGITMRPSGKWQVQIYHAGKSRYIGVFNCKFDAAMAYKLAKNYLSSFKYDQSEDEAKLNVILMRKTVFSIQKSESRKKRQKTSNRDCSSNTRRSQEQKINISSKPKSCNKNGRVGMYNPAERADIIHKFNATRAKFNAARTAQRPGILNF